MIDKVNILYHMFYISLPPKRRKNRKRIGSNLLSINLQMIGQMWFEMTSISCITADTIVEVDKRIGDDEISVIAGAGAGVILLVLLLFLLIIFMQRKKHKDGICSEDGTGSHLRKIEESSLMAKTDLDNHSNGKPPFAIYTF